MAQKWRAHQIDDGVILVENDERSVYVRGAHCVVCAYVEVLSKHGGDVDLRGLHRYSCFSFLRAVVRALRTGGEIPDGETRGETGGVRDSVAHA